MKEVVRHSEALQTLMESRIVTPTCTPQASVGSNHHVYTVAPPAEHPMAPPAAPCMAPTVSSSPIIHGSNLWLLMHPPQWHNGSSPISCGSNHVYSLAPPVEPPMAPHASPTMAYSVCSSPIIRGVQDTNASWRAAHTCHEWSSPSHAGTTMSTPVQPTRPPICPAEAVYRALSAIYTEDTVAPIPVSAWDTANKDTTVVLCGLPK
uniref:Uncharacterized protein LOC117348062 n=1 Tax=Geotrypetes seraphini TaxID=260995 RepID=A0A6P8NWT6_GEOSA|nr:uncharacterized protein LOC117348062 [Geotrypetes seraphini]